MNSRRLMGFTPLAENHLRKSLIRSSSESYAPHRSRTRELMSAMVQKRTSRYLQAMSALPPKADIRTWPVTFGAPAPTAWRLTVNDIQRGNPEYFRALHRQIAEGGAAAMMWDLQQVPLDGW